MMCLTHLRWWHLLLVLILPSHEGMERGGGLSSPVGTRGYPLCLLCGTVLQPWTPVQEPWSCGSLEVNCGPQTVTAVLMLKGVLLRTGEHHLQLRSWPGWPKAGSTSAQTPQNPSRGLKRSRLCSRLWSMM